MVTAIDGETRRPHAAMTMVQLFAGGSHVITKVALNFGVSWLVFCVYRDVLGLLILAPIAYFREKKTRPPITRRFLMSFFFVGLTGDCLLVCLGKLRIQLPDLVHSGF